MSLAGLAVAGVATLALITAANRNAQAVRDGRTAHMTLFGVRLTSWGADAATLAWTSDQIAPGLRSLADSCVMYLGRSDDSIYVYTPHTSPRRHSAFRRPWQSSESSPTDAASATSRTPLPAREVQCSAALADCRLSRTGRSRSARLGPCRRWAAIEGGESTGSVGRRDTSRRALTAPH